MAYITIAENVHTEMAIEKSRFITRVFPAGDEDTAKAHIHTVSKKHWDATHNCYAYVIGKKAQTQKASDDGEPSGTAGVPILEVIKKNGLTDVLIIVTRYFGGIKLGAGGLVRAYTRAASEGLKQAQRIRKEIHTFYELTVDYATWSRIEQPLKALGVLHDTAFAEHVTATLSVPAADEERLTQLLDKWRGASRDPAHRLQYEATKEDYVAVAI